MKVSSLLEFAMDKGWVGFGGLYTLLHWYGDNELRTDAISVTIFYRAADKYLVLLVTWKTTKT